MKKRLLILSTKMLSACLVALGFTGCDLHDGNDDNGGGGTFEYGTPTALFKVKGTVASTEKTPIRNIRAVLVEVYEGKEEAYSADTVYTRTDGTFDLKVSTFPLEKVEFKLKLEDIDGEDNGSFEPKTVAVVFEKAKFTDGNGWYKGETEKDVKTVELNPQVFAEPDQK